MDIDAEKYVAPQTIETVRQAGLHKIAGAMVGCDEVTIKEAVSILGAKAYLRRKEAGQVAAGIAAFAELRGEKMADAGFQELLRRSLMPAVAGAGLSMVPDLMSDGPFDADKAMQHALVGGALGGIGGAGRTIQRAATQNPGAWGSLGQTMQGLK